VTVVVRHAETVLVLGVGQTFVHAWQTIGDAMPLSHAGTSKFLGTKVVVGNGTVNVDVTTIGCTVVMVDYMISMRLLRRKRARTNRFNDSCCDWISRSRIGRCD
jgi:hypothetical protein